MRPPDGAQSHSHPPLPVAHHANQPSAPASAARAFPLLQHPTHVPEPAATCVRPPVAPFMTRPPAPPAPPAPHGYYAQTRPTQYSQTPPPPPQPYYPPQYSTPPHRPPYTCTPPPPPAPAAAAPAPTASAYRPYSFQYAPPPPPPAPAQPYQTTPYVPTTTYSGEAGRPNYNNNNVQAQNKPVVSYPQAIPASYVSNKPTMVYGANNAAAPYGSGNASKPSPPPPPSLQAGYSALAGYGSSYPSACYSSKPPTRFNTSAAVYSSAHVSSMTPLSTTPVSTPSPPPSSGAWRPSPGGANYNSASGPPTPNGAYHRPSTNVAYPVQPSVGAASAQPHSMYAAAAAVAAAHLTASSSSSGRPNYPPPAGYGQQSQQTAPAPAGQPMGPLQMPPPRPAPFAPAPDGVTLTATPPSNGTAADYDGGPEPSAPPLTPLSSYGPSDNMTLPRAAQTMVTVRGMRSVTEREKQA